MKTAMYCFIFCCAALFTARTTAAQAYDCTAQSEVPQTECEALVTFYNATGGDDWTTNDNWLSGDVSSWHGVTVSGGHVTKLRFSENGLSGTIPVSLTDLTMLEELVISGGTFEGAIPPELGTLQNLRSLALRGLVLLTAPIPSELGDLLNLETLDLSGNGITGTIPPSLGDLSSLTFLAFWGNELEGTLPVELGQLTNLEFLQVQRNNLTGPLPVELGALQSLTDLVLQDNEFSGPLPSEFGNLTNLERLYIDDTLLSGSLPLSLANLSMLTTFHFHDTNLCEPLNEAFQTWLQGVATVSSTGETCTPTPIESSNDLPATYTLAQNYPNPFNPVTTIAFTLPEATDVTLNVYDLMGREVATLVQGSLDAGSHAVPFHAGHLPSGTYVYRLQAGEVRLMQQLVLLK